MAINIWPAVSYVVDKLPIDKIFNRPRDRKKEMQELRDILIQQPQPPAKTAVNMEEPAPSAEPEAPIMPLPKPRVHLERHEEAVSKVTTPETVTYQNREIGKVLLQMERHAAQKFRIAGKICDCGQSRHLLDLESLCEESISMVDNPDIYNRILEYVKEVGPKTTIESLNSGKYDAELASFSTRARDLRKELLGTLDAHALFPSKESEKETEEVKE